MKQLIDRIAQVAYAFVLMNAASVQGLFMFARGRRTTWR
jgi:hypothetical protein